MVVFQFRSEINEHFLRRNRVAEFLNNLLDFVIKLSLRSDCVKA